MAPVIVKIVRAIVHALALGVLSIVAALILVIGACMIFDDADHAVATWVYDTRQLHGDYVDGSWEADVPPAFGHRDEYAAGALSFAVVSGCDARPNQQRSHWAIQCGPDGEPPKVSYRAPGGTWSAPQDPLFYGTPSDRDGAQPIRLNFHNPPHSTFDAVRIRIPGEPEIRDVYVRQSK